MDKPKGRPRSCNCGSCPKCKTREYQSGWYARQSAEKRKEIVAARDPEKVRKNDRERNKSPERLAHLTANAARWRKEYPDRARAHSAVAYALRVGKLVRQPCSECGATERVHAHHDDYSKPLEVRWLCPLHHAAERKE